MHSKTEVISLWLNEMRIEDARKTNKKPQQTKGRKECLAYQEGDCLMWALLPEPVLCLTHLYFSSAYLIFLYVCYNISLRSENLRTLYLSMG